jgi:hypothetical protein
MSHTKSPRIVVQINWSQKRDKAGRGQLTSWRILNLLLVVTEPRGQTSVASDTCFEAGLGASDAKLRGSEPKKKTPRKIRKGCFFFIYLFIS